MTTYTTRRHVIETLVTYPHDGAPNGPQEAALDWHVVQAVSLDAALASTVRTMDPNAHRWA